MSQLLGIAFTITALLMCLIEATVTSSGRQEASVRVVVHADTLLEVNGHSTIPPLFGIIFSESDPNSASRWAHLHVDTVGLSQTLGRILPSSLPDLTVSGLQYWLMSGSAHQQYTETSEYSALRSRQPRIAGARPMLFLRNPDGWCEPTCQQAYCWKRGGTPRVHSQWQSSYRNRVFDWWALLFAGNMDLALKADPSLRMVHIWNEPDIHFPMDNKNGSYYSNFFAAVAARIKNSWPEIMLGGPVSSNLPTGLLNERGSQNTWAEYVQPLIDRTATQNLLDFIDFHSDSSTGTLAGLLNSVETTVSYALVKYGIFLPIAVTGIKFRVANSSSATPPSLLYHTSCTFPLMVNTFALFKYPDKMIGRMLANKKITGNCQPVISPDGGQHSPEANVYYLLGMFSNGTRIRVTVKGQSGTGSCNCENEHVTGSSAVMGEGVLVDKNLTIAILNLCDCEMVTVVSFNGLQSIDVISSWAAMLDQQSLYPTEPLLLTQSYQQVTLPPQGLYITTYRIVSRYGNASQPTVNPRGTSHRVFSSGLRRKRSQSRNHTAQVFSKRTSHSKSKGSNLSQRTHKAPFSSQALGSFNPFPVQLTRVYQLTTAYPINSNWIMSTLPQPVPEKYFFTISYDMGRALDLSPYGGALRIGFLGAAGETNWTVTYLCSSDVTHPHMRHNNHAHNHHRHLHRLHAPSYRTTKPSLHSYGALKKCHLDLLSPGEFSEVSLPSTPLPNQYGYARLTFTCTSSQWINKKSKLNFSSPSYLAFSTIVLYSLDTPP